MDKESIQRNVDRRILKTKKKLEKALLCQLEEKSFSELTVKELCKVASVTTITFYTYYKDKYALAEVVFRDFADNTMQHFSNMQENNNKDMDFIQTCCNLLDGILYELSCLKEEYGLTMEAPDSYLFMKMAQLIIDNYEEYLGSTNIPQAFRNHAVASFFCYGLWGYVYDSLCQGVSIDIIQREAKHMIRTAISTHYA